MQSKLCKCKELMESFCGVLGSTSSTDQSANQTMFTLPLCTEAIAWPRRLLYPDTTRQRHPLCHSIPLSDRSQLSISQAAQLCKKQQPLIFVIVAVDIEVNRACPICVDNAVPSSAHFRSILKGFFVCAQDLLTHVWWAWADWPSLRLHTGGGLVWSCANDNDTRSIYVRIF